MTVTQLSTAGRSTNSERREALKHLCSVRENHGYIPDRVMGEVLEGLEEAERKRLLEGMHGVDLLAQHLTGLSAFARTLSLTAPTDTTVPAGPALAEITLGALAERMSAGLGGAEDVGEEADSGDCDLF